MESNKQIVSVILLYGIKFMMYGIHSDERFEQETTFKDGSNFSLKYLNVIYGNYMIIDKQEFDKLIQLVLYKNSIELEIDLLAELDPGNEPRDKRMYDMAVNDPIRKKIIEIWPLPVSEISKKLKLEVSEVNQHIRILVKVKAIPGTILK